jgi:2-isopropylmalate synthase
VVPDLALLTPLSHFVDEMANNAPNPRAPFVGAAAFAHKGGMHVNAVQKLARSYEHIEPSAIGNRQNILVSELAGGSNILMKAAELGVPLEKGDPRVRQILERIKNLEKDGYEFEAAAASFELLVRDVLQLRRSFFQLEEYSCLVLRDRVCGYESCEATVKLKVGEQSIHVVVEGDGPVNALDGAIRKALAPTYPHLSKMTLTDYKVRIIDSHTGTAAKTRVLIDSFDGTSRWGTVGVSYNIIDASWQALVDSAEYFLSRAT